MNMKDTMIRQGSSSDSSIAPVKRFELVCPAGSLPALKVAIDSGADCVYLGFRDETNARNFAGLNFDDAAIEQGVRYAHDKGRKVLVALNTYPQPGSSDRWRKSIDRAARAGVDAVILADPGLMQYAVDHYPALRLHLSVQGSATNYEAINFYREKFGIARAVCLVLLFALVELRVADPRPVEELRLRTFDLFQVLRPREQTIRPVVIVDIVEASVM